MQNEGKAKVVIRGNSGQTIEIERCQFSPPAPYDPDLLLNVTIIVGGFSAADQSWIVVNDWHAFLSQLRQLEKLRRGSATLESASPRDLKLSFNATDLLGHMVVTGFVGRETPDGFSQKLEFGFAFDPGMLLTFVRDFEKLELQS
jgi:hypothetical protein